MVLNGRCFWMASARAGVMLASCARSAAVAVFGLSLGAGAPADGAAACTRPGPASAAAARAIINERRVSMAIFHCEEGRHGYLAGSFGRGQLIAVHVVRGIVKLWRF